MQHKTATDVSSHTYLLSRLSFKRFILPLNSVLEIFDVRISNSPATNILKEISLNWVGLDSEKRIFSEKMRKDAKRAYRQGKDGEKRLLGTGKESMI